MNIPCVWVGCGVLRAELTELHRLGKISGELLFLDSMLHMVPQNLETALSLAVERLALDDRPIVVVYGDCCPRMLDLVRQYRAGRVNAINCAQMLVGRARYHELMQEQAFMLMPEWAHRWREIFCSELGLTEEVAHDLMRDNRAVLVYLDTGLIPVPEDALAACSAYTGLPLRIERVGLDTLLGYLLEAEAEAMLAITETCA